MPRLRDYDRLMGQRAYPGMTEWESIITRAWLRVHQDDYDTVEFNMRLGPGIELPEGTPEFVRRSAALSTGKRADIIARSPDARAIVEVKVRARFTALGQLIGYRALLQDQEPEGPPVRIVLVAQSLISDALAILESQGVEVELFPDVVLPQPREGEPIE